MYAMTSTLKLMSVGYEKLIIINCIICGFCLLFIICLRKRKRLYFKYPQIISDLYNLLYSNSGCKSRVYSYLLLLEAFMVLRDYNHVIRTELRIVFFEISLVFFLQSCLAFLFQNILSCNLYICHLVALRSLASLNHKLKVLSRSFLESSMPSRCQQLFL